MAGSERMQTRRKQCIFRLAFQHCPLRKLTRKVRGNNTYNIPPEPSERPHDPWQSFATVTGSLPPCGSSVLPQASIQTLAQGPVAPAFPLHHQIEAEMNREPSLWSMDTDVDPETGERA
ncbi:hypothetical protein chiPu_0018006 [Chiloscyllium punctatum]|uniref:Uncharacterized protein n=1 Tax=Chiloscyllium punctatum TaxID=137246 RepID=A0A401RKL3_CHIPU|nr:hypothetical protein [Chiloscyllium punctatum]